MRSVLFLCILLGSLVLRANGPASSSVVTAEDMQRVYEEFKTPYKYGVILTGGEGELVDCPNVFQHGDRWYMLYVASRNNQGYETFLAESEDLLNWTPKGKVLPFPEAGWDRWQADGSIALFDTTWGGSNRLGTHEGRYWMSYFGGDKQGYEPDPLSIGLASTRDPSVAEPWIRHGGNPVLTPSQPDAREFEQGTLYKSSIFRDPARTLGAEFVMFYNAKQKGKWVERIGIAVSDDMVTWKRHGSGPVIDNRTHISGDPQLIRWGDLWVMHYFGAGWKPAAFDTFAVSRDLVTWTKWEGVPLISPTEPWDKTFAHKPWLLKHEGVVYHFYCAVAGPKRVIALATSKNLKPAAPATTVQKP